MNFEVSKSLPAKPQLTCPWCGALLSSKHLARKSHAVYVCPKCGQMTNYSDVASAPSLYDALPENERARLTDWLLDCFTPATGHETIADDTYALKHRYQTLIDTYLYSGCLNGALLHLGFRPHDTFNTNWTFEMRWKKPDEQVANENNTDRACME